MKKKIFNIILLLVFLISTTSLPITVYLCSMDMDTECKMMNKDMMSHCEKEKTTADFSYKSDAKCCQVKVIDQSIKDNFIPAKIELKFGLSITALFPQLLEDIQPRMGEKNLIHLIHKFPPGIRTSHLYLNNSILLI